MRRMAVLLVAALIGLASPAGAAPEGSTNELVLTKPAYATWSTPVVRVHLAPSVKFGGWGLGKSIRAWSTGPVSLKVVSDPAAAEIRITAIPRHPQFWGNAEHTTLDSEMVNCAITLTESTRPHRRAHIAAHEMGHCLGLPHASAYRSIMDVFLRGNHAVPTDADMDWLRRSYFAN